MTTDSYRLTLWAAPKLGCESLYSKSEAMQYDGSFRPSMETKTARLVIGEPESHFFEIAPDMVEMKPSEAQQRLWDSLDLKLDVQQKAALLGDLQREGEEADKRYQRKRN